MTEPDFLRATRAPYDAIAPDYAERFRDELVARPLDRAMLAGFAELVRAPAWGRSLTSGGEAGLEVRARLVREPDGEGDLAEQTPQAFVLGP